jgi:hypothetical protein
MDFVVAVILSFLTAVTTSVVMTRRARHSSLLPAPGQNLELHTRVKELLDGAAAERDEAREESARLKLELDDVTAQRDKAEAKLRSANDVLRGFTHAKMDLKLYGEPVSVVKVGRPMTRRSSVSVG